MTNKREISNNENNIRNKFTILSFISSIMVIYIHSYNLDTYGITSKSTDLLSKIVLILEKNVASGLRIAVPFFFFISGILFFRTYEKSKLKEKYKSRSKTILIPYIVWCTIYYIYQLILTNIPIIKTYINMDKIPLSIIEWIKRIIVNEYYTLWFLKNLIVFIFITPFLYLLLKEKNLKKTYRFIFLIIIVIILEIINKAGNTLIDGLAYYMIGSYIGMNLKEYIPYKNLIISKISMIISIIIIPIITILKVKNIIIYILLYISFWYSLDLIKTPKKLPWWMSITFYIYVAHDAFLEALQKIIVIIFKTSPITALLDYILTPIITLIIIIISAKIIKKFFPKTWKFLTGGR